MLNIARTIYAAWNKGNTKYELPEAEIIPFGDSANEKRKLSKVTTRYTELFEHDNIPLPGFTLHKADRKNWGSLDQTWLVIDPRGFLVRITSENLEKILHVTGITEGLIQQKCVWARENTETKMQLVPVSSETFAEATQNTELLENKVDMKEVQIGDTVLLQNKLTGIYMGAATLYGPMERYTRDTGNKPCVQMRRKIIEVEDGKYHHHGDLKILKVVKKADKPLVREDAIKRMNDSIKSKKAFFTQTAQMTGQSYYSSGTVRLVSATALPKVTMTFEEITKDEARNLFGGIIAESDNGQLLLEDSAGGKFLVDFPYTYGATIPLTVDSFDVAKVRLGDVNAVVEVISIEPKKDNIWSGSFKAPNPRQYSLDKFTKFYKIVKHVKDETYV